MDTSTPAPPDGDESTGPVPRRETLATVALQIAAIDELIGMAKLSIRVYDMDLSRMGWNDPARARSLATFLRASPAARLEIIVQDTRWIEQSCPRLTQLLKYQSHAFAIKRSGDDARSAKDPLLIVDGIHFLHRLHIAQPRAVLSIGDPAAASPLVLRFDAISETAEPGISPTTLCL
jgi:hypothetical protein